MNLQRFLATWAGLTLENRINRIIILLLIGVNCVLAVTINQTDRTVVRCWKGRSRSPAPPPVRRSGTPGRCSSPN